MVTCWIKSKGLVNNNSNKHDDQNNNDNDNIRHVTVAHGNKGHGLLFALAFVFAFTEVAILSAPAFSPGGFGSRATDDLESMIVNNDSTCR